MQNDGDMLARVEKAASSDRRAEICWRSGCQGKQVPCCSPGDISWNTLLQLESLKKRHALWWGLCEVENGFDLLDQHFVIDA